MLIIVITGGIGSGKSTAVDMFRQYNVPIIDTDVIARQLVNSDPEILKNITEEFGQDILNNQQELDREKLREIVFNDEHQRQKLQNILHPKIHQQVLEELDSISSDYCILVIPLLAETQAEAGQRYPYDRVLLIDADEATQLERAAKRDASSKALIQKIIAAQASREKRRALADDVIDNNGTLDELQQQVDALHRHYSRLAKN
jgi:dephospho-CoA kinase